MKLCLFVSIFFTAFTNLFAADHVILSFSDDPQEICTRLSNQDVGHLEIRSEFRHDLSTLIPALEQNTSLRVLDLGDGNFISQKTFERLISALKGKPNFIGINLSRCTVYGDLISAMVIAHGVVDLMESTPTLTYVNVSRTGMSAIGTRSIIHAIPKSPVTSLILHGNEINEYGAQCIARALKDGKTFDTLDLTDCGWISYEVVKEIAVAAQGKVKELHMNHSVMHNLKSIDYKTYDPIKALWKDITFASCMISFVYFLFCLC